MSDVTEVLSAIEQGDPKAAEELLPLVYDELRKLAAAKLAQEKPGQTLQATALVHEAYLKLLDPGADVKWNGRGHFFGAAAEAMRRILLNRARDKGTQKRGASWNRVTLDAVSTPDGIAPEELIAIDDLLEELALRDPEAGKVAKLRIYAGLTIRETAEALGIPHRTIDRQWAFARAWLRTRVVPD